VKVCSEEDIVLVTTVILVLIKLFNLTKKASHSTVYVALVVVNLNYLLVMEF